jgi:hypothetical protein
VRRLPVVRGAATGLGVALALLAGACTQTVTVVVTPSSTPTGPSASPPPGTTFAQARGVRFAYPDDWRLLSSVATNGATINLVVSPDRESFIRLQRFAILLNVTEDRLPSLKPQIAALLRHTAEDVGGTVTAPLAREETAGLPGFVGSLRITTSRGNVAQEQLYVFFDETNEYTLACASTPSTREAVSAACALARETFAAPHPLP